MKKIIIATVAIATTALSTSMAWAEKSFVYWSMWNKKEVQAQIINQAIQDFERDTGIKVNVQWQGRKVITKVKPSLNAKYASADLVEQDAGAIYDNMVAIGKFTDMTYIWDSKVPNENKTVREVLMPAMADSLTLPNGKAWAVPFSLYSSAIWYDANRFPEIAKNPPQTWDELIALFQKHKDMGNNVIAQDTNSSWWNSMLLTELMIRAVGPGNLRKAFADKTGEALKDPRLLEAGKRIEQLVKMGVFTKGYETSKDPNQWMKWVNGEIDFLIYATWAMREDKHNKNAKFSSIHIPTDVGDGYKTTEISPFAMGIPSNAKNAKYAGEFVKYLMQKKYMQRYATEARAFSSRRDVVVEDGLKGIHASISTYKMSHSGWDKIGITSASIREKVIYGPNNDLLRGKITAEEWQKRLVKDTIKFWKFN